MTIPIHRDTDPRVCGATTVVENQSTVYANGLLVAVDGDPNSHGAGNLIADCNNVFINGKEVVNHSPDDAVSDNAGHGPPVTITAGGSSNVFVGD